MKPTLIFIFVFVCFISITLSCVCNHGTCNGDVCVCNQYYEGSDCSIYNRAISAGNVISDSISEYNWKYYHFSPSNSDTSMTITLTQTSNGDVDVYVSTSAYPSASNFVTYDDSSDTHITINLPINSQTYYIGLYGYSACTYDLEVEVEEGCINNCNGNGQCDMSRLTCNCFTPYTGADCSIYDEEIAFGETYHGHISNHQWVYYHFTSAEVSDLSVIMTQEQSSSIQLFVRKTIYPTFTFFDYANTTLSTQVEIHVQNLDTSYWVIGLYGYVGGIYSLTVSLEIPEIPHCTNDCSLHGTCESQVCTCNEGYLGDACEYMVILSSFDEEYSGLVSASYWNYYPVQFVTSQSINVHLNKLSGNCNLYIRPVSYPTRVAYQYFDTSSDQEVDLIIQYPGSNAWYVGVYGYSDCNYTIEFSFIDRCQCSEGANGYCETGSTYCICDPGWAGTGCDVQATRLESFDVVFDAVQKNEMKFYYVVSNSSALIITMVEKNTKSFAWLLIGTDGYPTLDDHDDLNYGYAGELSFHENRYLWSSKRERTHYITVMGSSVDVSPDPVQYAITVYSTPF